MRLLEEYAVMALNQIIDICDFSLKYFVRAEGNWLRKQHWVQYVLR